MVLTCKITIPVLLMASFCAIAFISKSLSHCLAPNFVVAKALCVADCGKFGPQRVHGHCSICTSWQWVHDCCGCQGLVAVLEARVSLLGTVHDCLIRFRPWFWGLAKITSTHNVLMADSKCVRLTET